MAVFLSPRKFNSPYKIYQLIPQILLLGLYFLIASCSIKGPKHTTDIYQEKPYKYGQKQDNKFDYRKNRLKTEKQPTPFLKDPPIHSVGDLKGFADDMDSASLKRVINNQLAVMFEQDEASPVRLGDFTVTRGRLVETLQAFQKLLQKKLPQEEFNKKVSEEFLLYRVGKGQSKKILFR